MIDPKQLLDLIIRPVLRDLDLWSEQAERLLLGTACKESECGRWLKQLGGGPALGIFQMEENTHDDIWMNYLDFKPVLARKIGQWCLKTTETMAGEMVGNLYYAAAMCRVHYLRAPDAIPDTLAGQARYWKTHYNSPMGAGTESEYMNTWNRMVPPEILAA